MLPPYPNDRALLEQMMRDPELRELRLRVISILGKYKYAYNFTWWGRPIIQMPQDVMAMQMLVLAIQPDLIIETGVAHGGSLIFNASMLELLGGDRRVIGVDIEIRKHNREAIEAHPMAKRIDLVEGSSTDPGVVAKVRELAAGRETVPVSRFESHARSRRQGARGLFAVRDRGQLSRRLRHRDR
jgi:cephalosporin hydroxylase